MNQILDQELDERFAASDRWTDAALAALDLDDARESLRREITATPRPVGASAHGRPQRFRWAPTVAAAAAVAAVVATGVALGTAGNDRVAPEPPAAEGPSSLPSGSTDPARIGGPSLPPTPDNLHQVLVDAPGWKVTHADSDPTWGGSLAWKRGISTADLTWYPADQYDSYVTDRRAVGPAQPVSLLGQDGTSYAYPRSDAEVASDRVVVVDPTAGADEPDDPAVPDVVRRHLLLPPVGDWFLEVDVTLPANEDLSDFTSSLRRVSLDDWVTYLAGQGIIVPAAARAFLAEAGRGVTLPPGTTIAAADLHLPQDTYQARVAFLRPVMCGWVGRLVGARANGDAAAEQQAVDALTASADWPVMRALEPDGDFAEVFASESRKVIDGESVHLSESWGC